MSRTIKALPYRDHRPVKGHNRAAKAKLYEEDTPPVRNRAIPPDPWEDLPIDDQAFMPYRAVDRMMKEGKDKEFVARKVSRKFKISYLRALEIAGWYEKWRK